MVGALKLAEKHGLNAEYLCIGIAAGMMFDPAGDDNSKQLATFSAENGVKETLAKYGEYTGKYADLIETLYGMLKCGKQISALVKYCEEVSGKEIRV